MPILSPSPAVYADIVSRLRGGDCIGLPTETVYGLAARADDSAAVVRIYETKQRPRFNPLICHVSGVEMAMRYGVFSPTALRLAQAYWAGPLTLIVPRQRQCPADALVSAGLDTIALRQPDHPAMARVIEDLGVALAAPSANPSGRLSPTSAAHVEAMLPALDVLDGGACRIGVESTIIGCFENDEATLLRAGGLARSEIEAFLGYALADDATDLAGDAKRAPGRLAQHYAPRAQLILDAPATIESDRFLGFGDVMTDDARPALNLSAAGDLREAAANLFAYLHRLDRQGAVIGVAPIPMTGLGEAINDRLRRAAAR